VFIKLTAKIGKAGVIGGLENNVSRYLDSVQIWSWNLFSGCHLSNETTLRPHRSQVNQRDDHAGNSVTLR
jgi:hypothetical protein